MERICKAFRKNKDGSWTCTAGISFSVPGGHVEAMSGTTFIAGQLHAGLDVAAWLTQNCSVNPKR